MAGCLQKRDDCLSVVHMSVCLSYISQFVYLTCQFVYITYLVCHTCISVCLWCICQFVYILLNGPFS